MGFLPENGTVGPGRPGPKEQEATTSTDPTLEGFGDCDDLVSLQPVALQSAPSPNIWQASRHWEISCIAQIQLSPRIYLLVFAGLGEPGCNACL